MSSKRHRHKFTLLYWHFGPAKKQDVHVHSCFDRDCTRVLIGTSRECIEAKKDHKRETL